MINYYNVLFPITIIGCVNSQYLLREYASNHDNYEPAHYSFAYGVSDPHTGDHKHHWEMREGDNVKGEYGLLEADGVTRIVEYTSDPRHGFQAIVRRLHIPPEQYTNGHLLYGKQNEGLYNTEQQNQSGELQNQSEENQNVEIGEEEDNNQYKNEDASSENVYVRVGDVIDCVKKQIVKKNNAENHFNYPSSIGEVESTSNEKQELYNTNSGYVQDGRQTETNLIPVRYGQPVFQQQIVLEHYPNSVPIVNQNTPNVIPTNRRAFQEFPSHEGILLNRYNSQKDHIHQYVPLEYSNFNQAPEIGQIYHKPSQEITLPQTQTQLYQNVSFEGKVLNNINQEGIPTYQNKYTSTQYVPQTSPNQQFISINKHSNYQYDQNPNKNLAQQNDFPLILVDPYGHFGYPFYPHTQTRGGLFHIPYGQGFGYEGIPVTYPNHQEDAKASSSNTKLSNSKSNQNIKRRIDKNYNTESSSTNFPLGTAPLNERNNLPVNIYNLQFHGYNTVPQNIQPVNDYQYQSNQNILTATNQNYPPGSTRDTIWNAGDPTAHREPEVLVRQLNATCAYFQFNETTPGTEDGSKPNIFNAGDYTAHREETELIRSINVTCDNFTTDALNNFTSGYTIAQYCAQCYENYDGYKNNNSDDNNNNNYNGNQRESYDFTIPKNFDNNFWVPPSVFPPHYVNSQPVPSVPFPFNYNNFGQETSEGNEERYIYKRSRVKRLDEDKVVEEKA